MTFPENFVWGAATASFQIEGGYDADGKGPSIWDRFCEVPGNVKLGHTGDVACDHYHRFEEDIELMRRLGLEAYRFSISWSRIFPEGTGAVSEKGISFYDRLIDVLLEAGIQPWATLYHWDLPWALHERGGWLSPESPHWFEQYATLIAQRFGDRVENWFTINEPQVFIGLGYCSGEHAPGYRVSLAEALQAGHHSLLAHGRAAAAIRAHASKLPRIGAAPVGICVRPRSEDPDDVEAARAATFAVSKPYDHSPAAIQGSLWNSAWWMDPLFKGAYPDDGLEAYGKFAPRVNAGDMEIIKQPIDFFGANIYHGQTVQANGQGGFSYINAPPGSPINSMGWDITPDILYWGPKFFYERYGLPIVITENGVATVEFGGRNGTVTDAPRSEFISRYLQGVKRGLGESIPYEGYFYWSLLDNFEWAEGYTQRFGIVHVDYATQERTLKSSALDYARIINERGANL